MYPIYVNLKDTVDIMYWFTYFLVGPCWYEEKFHHVCSLISGDTILHTLVRGKPNTFTVHALICLFKKTYCRTSPGLFSVCLDSLKALHSWLLYISVHVYDRFGFVDMLTWRHIHIFQRQFFSGICWAVLHSNFAKLVNTIVKIPHFIEK